MLVITIFPFVGCYIILTLRHDVKSGLFSLSISFTKLHTLFLASCRESDTPRREFTPPTKKRENGTCSIFFKMRVLSHLQRDTMAEDGYFDLAPESKPWPSFKQSKLVTAFSLG